MHSEQLISFNTSIYVPICVKQCLFCQVNVSRKALMKVFIDHTFRVGIFWKGFNLREALLHLSAERYKVTVRICRSVYAQVSH